MRSKSILMNTSKQHIQLADCFGIVRESVESIDCASGTRGLSTRIVLSDLSSYETAWIVALTSNYWAGS